MIGGVYLHGAWHSTKLGEHDSLEERRNQNHKESFLVKNATVGTLWCLTVSYIIHIRKPLTSTSLFHIWGWSSSLSATMAFFFQSPQCDFDFFFK